MSDMVKTDFSRRQFITGLGGLGIGAIFAGTVGGTLLRPDRALAVAASKGYIVVDPKKCSGCYSCELMCSLVHEGKENLNLARIQIINDSFAGFPNDLMQFQCRQCPSPACVQACPTGAMHVDTENGNIRTVDASKCIGCERCINACPFTPSRVQWNNEAKHAQKCDLCQNTPFWSEQGGFDGKQACVEVCPNKAVELTHTIPSQTGDSGYQLNMRTEKGWAKLGFPIDDAGAVIGDNTLPMVKGGEQSHPAGKTGYFTKP